MSKTKQNKTGEALGSVERVPFAPPDGGWRSRDSLRRARCGRFCRPRGRAARRPTRSWWIAAVWMLGLALGGYANARSKSPIQAMSIKQICTKKNHHVDLSWRTFYEHVIPQKIFVFVWNLIRSCLNIRPEQCKRNEADDIWFSHLVGIQMRIALEKLIVFFPRTCHGISLRGKKAYGQMEGHRDIHLAFKMDLEKLIPTEA